jgi:hypothetical protein
VFLSSVEYQPSKSYIYTKIERANRRVCSALLSDDLDYTWIWSETQGGLRPKDPGGKISC